MPGKSSKKYSPKCWFDADFSRYKLNKNTKKKRPSLGDVFHDSHWQTLKQRGRFPLPNYLKQHDLVWLQEILVDSFAVLGKSPSDSAFQNKPFIELCTGLSVYNLKYISCIAKKTYIIIQDR